MRVAHLSATVGLKRGGVSSAVLDACAALSRAGADVTLFAACPERDLKVVSERAGGASLELHPAEVGRGWEVGQAIGRRLAGAHRVRAFDILHVHGLWLPSTLIGSYWAVRNGVPLVTSTHGMLMPWAMRNAGWKKLPIWLLAQRPLIRRSRRVLCTSDEERDALPLPLLRKRSVIIPNGIPRMLEEVAPITPRPLRRVVFLGRKHPVKNLPALIRAWSAVRPAGWELVVAGADEGGHEAELRSMVAELRLEAAVRFEGECYGQEKTGLLQSADLLALPSHMENFGLVVAEALSAGRPVLVSTGAPWRLVEERQCGWWVKPDGWETALAAAVGCTPDTLAQMGARGRDLVRERFLSSSIAAQTVAVYREVISDHAA